MVAPAAGLFMTEGFVPPKTPRMRANGEFTQAWHNRLRVVKMPPNVVMSHFCECLLRPAVRQDDKTEGKLD